MCIIHRITEVVNVYYTQDYNTKLIQEQYICMCVLAWVGGGGGGFLQLVIE